MNVSRRWNCRSWEWSTRQSRHTSGSWKSSSSLSIISMWSCPQPWSQVTSTSIHFLRWWARNPRNPTCPQPRTKYSRRSLYRWLETKLWGRGRKKQNSICTNKQNPSQTYPKCKSPEVKSPGLRREGRKRRRKNSLTWPTKFCSEGTNLKKFE